MTLRKLCETQKQIKVTFSHHHYHITLYVKHYVYEMGRITCSCTYHFLLKFIIKGVVGHLHRLFLKLLLYPWAHAGWRGRVVGVGRRIVTLVGIVRRRDMMGECLGGSRMLWNRIESRSIHTRQSCRSRPIHMTTTRWWWIILYESGLTSRGNHIKREWTLRESCSRCVGCLLARDAVPTDGRGVGTNTGLVLESPLLTRGIDEYSV